MVPLRKCDRSSAREVLRAECSTLPSLLKGSNWLEGDCLCFLPFPISVHLSSTFWWQARNVILPPRAVGWPGSAAVKLWHGLVAETTDGLKSLGIFPSFAGKLRLNRRTATPFLNKLPLTCLGKDMQKFNSAGTHSSTLPRDAELQLRLADSGGAGEGKENGAGKHFLAQPEESSFCTKRKMLVGLDVICLCVGKKRPIFVLMVWTVIVCYLLQLNNRNQISNLKHTNWKLWIYNDFFCF